MEYVGKGVNIVSGSHDEPDPPDPRIKKSLYVSLLLSGER